MAAFLKITQGKGGGNQGGASFQQSMESLLSASEGFTSALEQELVRRVQLQSSWNRKDRGPGPTIKMLASRLTFAIGRILCRFERPSPQC